MVAYSSLFWAQLNRHDSNGVLIESKALEALKKTRLRAVDCVLGDCWLLCKAIDAALDNKSRFNSYTVTTNTTDNHEQSYNHTNTQTHPIQWCHYLLWLLAICKGVLFVDRRFLINGFLRFIRSVFRALCCGVQMTTATTYSETSQLSLFDFFWYFFLWVRRRPFGLSQSARAMN